MSNHTEIYTRGFVSFLEEKDPSFLSALCKDACHSGEGADDIHNFLDTDDELQDCYRLCDRELLIKLLRGRHFSSC